MHRLDDDEKEIGMMFGLFVILCIVHAIYCIQRIDISSDRSGINCGIFSAIIVVY